MKATSFFISTLKDAPADAEVASHQLMVRAGMIKKLGAGIYTYMPMGLRVIRKIEAIVREEMNRAGAVELSMPVVQPAELWQESGRFEGNGPELLRFKDRHDRDFIVQPTSEEVATDIARQELKSYKQLPKNFYQIQTKFRDERRPRFGVMRGREFTMKDAYSFDRDLESAKKSYQIMAQAYRTIFDRFGLRYRAVAADSGAIGGDFSEEFQVIAATGEDAIVYCPTSDYAANMEKAEALTPSNIRAASGKECQKTATPGKSTCADVATLLGVPLQSTVKSIVLAVDRVSPENALSPPYPEIWLLLLRGDHSLNEVKANKIPGLTGFRFATIPEIEAAFGTKPGYLGPVGLKHMSGAVPIQLMQEADRQGLQGATKAAYIIQEIQRINARVVVVADRDVAIMSDFICGANEEGFHLTGVNWSRDLPEPELVADIHNVVEGDASPDGKGVLAIERGIEVGHIFILGKKYSESMNATFLGDNGKPQHFEMGCYGIGITRLPAAAIEQNHDDKGIIWPDAIAPFQVVLCPLGYERNEAVKLAADTLHDELIALGLDVMLDDRGFRPGQMFADWELIGVPHRVVISERGLGEGKYEYQGRRDAEATKVDIAHIASFVRSRVSA